MRAAVRQFDVDHDVWAVLDEVRKRGIIAGDPESAIPRGRGFADKIVRVFIAIVHTHTGARNRLS